MPIAAGALFRIIMELIFQKIGFALATDRIGKKYQKDGLTIRRFSDDRFLIVKDSPKIKLYEGRIETPAFAHTLIDNIK